MYELVRNLIWLYTNAEPSVTIELISTEAWQSLRWTVEEFYYATKTPVHSADTSFLPRFYQLCLTVRIPVRILFIRIHCPV